MARTCALGAQGRGFKSHRSDMNLSQFTKNNCYLMLALDHRESFKKIISQNQSLNIKKEVLIERKKEIIKVLFPYFSSLLIDVDYGLPAYLSLKIKKPYLLAIEKSGYVEKDNDRLTKLEYSVSKIKKLGASGVKLLIYFNPFSKWCLDQLRLAGNVLKESRNHNLPLFLEIVTYHNEKSIIKHKVNLVIESVKKFLSFGIRPAVFKLEHPGDSVSVQLLGKILKGIDWILLSRGENFSIFKHQLTNAVLNGAKGFLAGRSLWQEIGNYEKKQDRIKFLETIVVKRFKEISEIVKENIKL